MAGNSEGSSWESLLATVEKQAQRIESLEYRLSLLEAERAYEGVMVLMKAQNDMLAQLLSRMNKYDAAIRKSE